MPLYSDPKAPTPIRVEQQPELDPSLVAANRRFMQSRDQARYLIHKTARDETDAQTGIKDDPEMRALKLLSAREELIAAKMANTGATREEVMPEVEAEMARRLLQPGAESAAAREAARLGRGGVERVGFRQVWGQRQEVLKRAGSAVDSGDGAIVSQILGVQAKYDTAPDAFQKAWTVGGVRMSPSEVRQKVLDKAGQMVTQAAHEPFAPTLAERGMGQIQRQAEESMLPSIKRAPTKPKPVEWKPTGISGLFFDPANPGVTQDFREPTADIYHMGDRLVEVRRDKAGKIIGKPRERYVKPEEIDYTIKSMEVMRDGTKWNELWWVPNKPGAEAKRAIAEPMPGAPDEVQGMRLWETRGKVDVPVLVRMRGAEVLSRFYPEDRGRKLSAEELAKWKEDPTKRNVSWVSENIFDKNGKFVSKQTRMRVHWLDAAGELRYWEGVIEQGGIGQVPTEQGAGMGVAAGATLGAPSGAGQPAAPQAAAPAPQESGLEQNQVNAAYDALRQERPDLDPKSEEFEAVLEKRLSSRRTGGVGISQLMYRRGD